MGKNKMDISVVGNAKSIFGKKDGKLIDSADLVIRFNGGVIINPESQGIKTDILAYSLYKKNLKDFGEVEYWVTNSFEERNTLQQMLNTKPTNGLIVLERLKNKYKDHHVRIFGFDWKETITWYRDPPTKLEHHDYEKEKGYCLELIKQFNWELY